MKSIIEEQFELLQSLIRGKEGKLLVSVIGVAKMATQKISAYIIQTMYICPYLSDKMKSSEAFGFTAS